ncbi:MAG: hypothetical protein EOO15_18200 [Chitinophagaceae bacterium]|nr:MAG: hypothetical protein EOO15_18200 [Chitinophagaceae bacterium]
MRDFLLSMLTPEEKGFVDFWSVQRLRRKSIASRLSSGLPLGVFIVLVLFVSIFTGWYQRATAIIRTHSSVILVVILAAVGIVLFMSYFSAQHEWDQNEERYQALLHREEKQQSNIEL